jgi:hemolysin III
MDEAPMGKTEKTERKYSLGEEIANAVTHGVGALLSLAAFVVLVAYAAKRGDAIAVTSYAIFGASLILLYTMSTIYHSLTAPKAKKVFEVLDHSSIYILIAGTYTPFSLAVLRGALGWWIFGIVWGCAVLGITFKALFINRLKVLSTLAYIGMGWIVVFAVVPLLKVIDRTAFAFLLAGGVAYTGGTVFYLMKKVKWTHSIWHLFVLAGSACHFISALYCL